MSTFTWQVPTRVRRGPGVLDDIGSETAALGPRAAVVVDARVCALPIVLAAMQQLSRHGVRTPVVLEVFEPPSLDRLAALVRRMAQERVTVVVGIGGGATMDLAKASALASCNADLLVGATWERADVVDRYQERSLVPGLPTVLVPTTAATGSEVNPVAAIEHGGRRRLLLCGALVAATALVDPRLLASLRTGQLLEGAIETFVRLLCPYLSDDRCPGDVTDRLSETLCAAVLSLGDQVADGRRDADVDAEIQWLGTLSGSHVATVGRPDWGHSLWYLQAAVGEMTGLPKAPAISALLPAYLEWVDGGAAFGARLGDSDRLARLVHAVAPVLGGGAHGAADALRRLLIRWGLPTDLGQIGVDDDHALGRLSLLAHRRWAGTGRFDGATVADFQDFFRSAADRRASRAGSDAGQDGPGEEVCSR
jgi:alcohol dehydrogenase class IV